MAQAINRKTNIVREQVFETRYEKKHWFIFSWYIKVSSKKVSDDLIISTTDNINKIYISRDGSPLNELIIK